MTCTFEITVSAPDGLDVTAEQMLEWVEFCTGYRGSIPVTNPLHEYDLDATDVMPA